MERVNAILRNETYRQCLDRIRECEKDRMFCHHDMAHFLDVARLAYLIDMEEHMEIPKERIYAAALLHDIGRHLQYLEGIPHEIASARIAPAILHACGFDEKESGEICEAIMHHRNSAIKEHRNLSGLIYRGDKLSRSCFGCSAEQFCNWEKEKKNLNITL